jgi:hypothetical protein
MAPLEIFKTISSSPSEINLAIKNNSCDNIPLILEAGNVSFFRDLSVLC